MSEALRIVLVDDSRTAVSQIEGLLAEIEGVEVVGTAGDALMGASIVAQRRPDIVLLDLVMPLRDGISALRMIRSQCPDVRVAMVSSVAAASARAEEAFRLGAVQVLGKPVDPEQLASLCEIEREHKLERERQREHERVLAARRETAS